MGSLPRKHSATSVVLAPSSPTIAFSKLTHIHHYSFLVTSNPHLPTHRDRVHFTTPRSDRPDAERASLSLDISFWTDALRWPALNCDYPPLCSTRCYIRRLVGSFKSFVHGSHRSFPQEFDCKHGRPGP
jgi:hypothetical protein